MVILGLGIITQMHVCHDEYALVSLCIWKSKFIRWLANGMCAQVKSCYSHRPQGRMSLHYIILGAFSDKMVPNLTDLFQVKEGHW